MGTFLIGGSQRSGTTLCQLLLCQDSTVNPMIKEASYLRFLTEGYTKAKRDFENDTKYYFNSPEDLRCFHSSLISLFLNRTLSRFPKAQHLVLKEPHLGRLFPDFFELDSTTRFIIMVRDPRDTIASMLRVGEKMNALGQKHFFQNRDIHQLVNHYKAFYIPSLGCKHPKFQRQLIIIKYEDLALNPEPVLATLHSFTGIELSANLSENLDAGEIDWNKDYVNRYEAWHTDSLGTPPSPQSIGRYKNMLTEAEISQIENECRDFMEVFSYRS